MVTLKTNEKEFSLIPKTKKVVELTDKLKTKNLNDLIFNGLNDGNLKVLVELIKTFAVDSEGKQVFYSVDTVYDFIDEWTMENNCSYTELYKEVIKVTNDMGFLKKKMETTDLQEEMKNPLMNIDMNEIIINSAQKAVDTIAQEEFRGFKG